VSGYFLGVDVGGTKCHALLASEDGRALGLGQAGPGNYEVVGWEGLRLALHTCVAQALTAAGLGVEQVAAAGFGVAGYDWPGEREPTLQAIASLGLRCPVELVNDAVIALLAGASRGWGVAVIAGTSNNCRGRDRQGREGRTTGCGLAMGENGGAAELLAQAVKLVAAAWTRRGPQTALTDAFCRLVGALDADDLLEGLYLQRYHLTPDAAPVVFETAAGGDPVAADLVRWNGRELASLALGVIRQLELERQEFELILAGSLYDGSPAMVSAMEEAVHALAPGTRLVRLHAPPVAGGVLLAMERAGSPPAAVRRRLVESTRSLLAATAGG
jgi:N-acetylglucosamine kinase-like BadF-type ATPase